MKSKNRNKRGTSVELPIMLCNFEGKVQSKMALGEEFRINIGNMNTENMSKSDCIQSKHKETLNQIKIMIGHKKINSNCELK